MARHMRFEDIFILKDGVAELKHYKDTLIPDLRTIIKRDKGQNRIKGDAEGKLKKWATMELTAVYFIADYRSPGRKQGLEGEDLLAYAIKQAGLPSNWRPDDVVMRFIDYYEDNVSEGTAARLVSSLYNTFRLAIDVVNTIRTDFKAKLNRDDLSNDEKLNMIREVKELLSLGSDLGKQLTELTKVEESLRKEEETKRLGRGNVEIVSSMEPEDDDDE